MTAGQRQLLDRVIEKFGDVRQRALECKWVKLPDGRDAFLADDVVFTLVEDGNLCVMGPVPGGVRMATFAPDGSHVSTLEAPASTGPAKAAMN